MLIGVGSFVLLEELNSLIFLHTFASDEAFNDLHHLQSEKVTCIHIRIKRCMLYTFFATSFFLLFLCLIFSLRSFTFFLSFCSFSRLDYVLDYWNVHT